MSDGVWSLIVHGGARTIPPDLQAANRRGCLAAAERGAAILRRGGTALETAEQAVRELEDDPTFNAGKGSVPTSSGQIEMDAAIMDGRSLEIGAVAALRGISNPVAVARLLLKEKTVLLVGERGPDIRCRTRHCLFFSCVMFDGGAAMRHGRLRCSRRPWQHRSRNLDRRTDRTASGAGRRRAHTRVRFLR